MQIHEASFDPDFTYETETFELVTNDEKKMLGIGIQTPDGKRVLIGISGVQMNLLLMQLRDAHQVLPKIREWQPFRPE